MSWKDWQYTKKQISNGAHKLKKLSDAAKASNGEEDNEGTQEQTPQQQVAANIGYFYANAASADKNNLLQWPSDDDWKQAVFSTRNHGNNCIWT